MLLNIQAARSRDLVTPPQKQKQRTAAVRVLLFRDEEQEKLTLDSGKELFLVRGRKLLSFYIY